MSGKGAALPASLVSQFGVVSPSTGTPVRSAGRPRFAPHPATPKLVCHHGPAAAGEGSPLRAPTTRTWVPHPSLGGILPLPVVIPTGAVVSAAKWRDLLFLGPAPFTAGLRPRRGLPSVQSRQRSSPRPRLRRALVLRATCGEGGTE
jgi:hypothetical protein